MQAAAEAAEDHVDGVWFVGLATLTDVDLVVAGMAQTFGLREGAAERIATCLGTTCARDGCCSCSTISSSLSRSGGGGRGARGRVCRRRHARSQPRAAQDRRRARMPVPPLVAAEAVTLFAERARLELNGDRSQPSRRSARGSTSCRWRSSWPRRVKVLPRRQWLERLEQRLPLQPAVRATPPSASEPFARRSLGATTCSMSVSALSRASRRSRAAASRRPRPSASLKSTRSARCWTKTCSAARSRATNVGDVREFARSSGSTRQLTPPSSVAAMPSTSSPSLEAQPELVRRDQRHFLDRLEADHDNFRAALSWLLDRDRERTEPRSRARRVLCARPAFAKDETGSSRCSKARRGAERHACRSTRLGGVSLEQLGENARGLLEDAVACAREADAAAALALALSHLPIALADGDEEDRRPGRRSGHRRAGRAIRSSSAPP